MVFKGFICKLKIYKILIHVIKCYVANILFVCLVARPLSGGELLRFLGKRSMKRTTTGILLIFLFFETVCDFFNWVNLSEILVGDTGR